MGQLQALIVPVTPFQQNCGIYFDSDEKRAVVVDPGGDVERIIEALKSQQLEVDEIWITHGHIDHVGAAAELKRLLGVEIVGPQKADEFLLQQVESSAAKYGFAGVAKNFVPDRWLEDGDRVSLAGGHEFDVLHCPGHSPGHVVFFNKDARFAIMGDVLFNGSVGRTDLSGGDHDTLIASIRNKLLPLGDDVGFICGHGPGSRIGDERRNNPFLV